MTWARHAACCGVLLAPRKQVTSPQAQHRPITTQEALAHHACCMHADRATGALHSKPVQVGGYRGTSRDVATGCLR